MKQLIKFVSFLLFIISGCENPTSVTTGQAPSAFQERLQRVNIKQIDYYTILFENTDSLLVDKSEIEKIIFGYYNNDIFVGVDSLAITHTTSNKTYTLLSFSDTLEFSDSLSEVTVELKYILKNFEPFIIKKDMFLFSYPYESTRIILNYNTFRQYGWIQDFFYEYPLLYYHPTGPDGIFQYNVSTGQQKIIIDYSAGDFMDGSADYLFYDYAHYSIRRYNLKTNSVDAENDILNPEENYSLSGMAVDDTLVYLIATNGKLYTFNLALNLLDTKDVPLDYYSSLAYYKGYLYSLRFETDNRIHIIKINAATGEITDDNKSPTFYTIAIKISKDGVLYFMEDIQKKFCYTWLDEIFH